MKKYLGQIGKTIILTSLLTPTLAMATNGYFSHGYGIKSKGAAGAGVATASDAIAAATNPAGMALIGSRVDFGVELFQPKRTATTRDDNVSYTGDGDKNFLIPEFGYNHMFNNGMSFGVTVYGNGGLNTKYQSIPQYSGNPNGSNTGVDLAQLFISPTFAIKINDKQSFGVSLNLIYQTFEATGLGAFCGFKSGSGGPGCPNFGGIGSAAANAGLTDQGGDSSTGYSIKLGWIGQITDSLSLGVSYQTESDMSKFDKYNQLFAEQGDFDIPSNYTIGLNYRPNKKWSIAFDIQRINFSDIASVGNPNDSANLGGSGAGQGFLGSDNGLGFGWEDMTIYKLGVEYLASSNFLLRFGYSKGDQPIGADDTSFNLIAPAVIEEHATVGGTWTLSNKSELSFYYMHAFENTVTGSTNVPGTNGNANLTMEQDALGIAYGWRL